MEAGRVFLFVAEAGRVHFFCYACYGGRAPFFFAMEAGRVYFFWYGGRARSFFGYGGRARCEDAPRESAILGEIARTLHTRTRFCAKMQRHCAAFPNETTRMLHAAAPFCAKI